MSTINEIIIYSLTIFIFCISPLPALPAVISSYSLNGNLIGFTSTLIGSISSSIFLYFLSRNLSIKISNIFISNRNNLIDKIVGKITKISTLELFLIMMSNQIPKKILDPASGIAKINFKKFLLARTLANLPIHLVYVASSSKFNNIKNTIFDLTQNEIESIFLSISICSSISFLLLFSIKSIPSLKK